MSSSSVGTALLFGKILWVLITWYLGATDQRALRAKELSALLAKVRKQGDALGKQLRDELNKHSDKDWDDIDIRKG
jgi:hypothetical protein